MGKTRKYRNYCDEDLKRYTKEVKSIAGLLRKIDLRPCGGNYYTIKKKLKKLKIDCSHWTGQGWNKGEQLKKWEDYKKTGNLKKHLISHRGKKCEFCKREKWNNEEIPLELNHIDGDRLNNKFENLEILCCNCHAQTKTWRGRNARNDRNYDSKVEQRCHRRNNYLQETQDFETKENAKKIEKLKKIEIKRKKQFKKKKKKEKYFCLDCGKEIKRKSIKRCLSCSIIASRKIKERPTKKQLIENIQHIGYCGTGRKYNVSDNTIRKWIK